MVIPPAFGLKGVGFETYTGDGPVSYWNNYVAVTQMGGHGSFSDPRLGINIVQTPDLVTPKLPALVAVPAQPRRRRRLRPAASTRRRHGAARASSAGRAGARSATRRRPTPTCSDTDVDAVRCCTSHRRPAWTRCMRAAAATGLYRATPLRALATHAPYFHDGSAPDLDAVVDHYMRVLGLSLSDRQKADLVEFLKSL